MKKTSKYTRMSLAEAYGLLFAILLQRQKAGYTAERQPVFRSKDMMKDLPKFAKTGTLEAKFAACVLTRLNCMEPNPSHFGRYLHCAAKMLPGYLTVGPSGLYRVGVNLLDNSDNIAEFVGYLTSVYTREVSGRKVDSSVAHAASLALSALTKQLNDDGHVLPNVTLKKAMLGSQALGKPMREMFTGLLASAPAKMGRKKASRRTVDTESSVMSPLFAWAANQEANQGTPDAMSTEKLAAFLADTLGENDEERYKDEDYARDVDELVARVLAGVKDIVNEALSPANNAHSKAGRVTPAKRGTRGVFAWHSAPHPGLYMYAGKDKNCYSNNVEPVAVQATGQVIEGWYAYICDLPELKYPPILRYDTPTDKDIGLEVYATNGDIARVDEAQRGTYHGQALLGNDMMKHAVLLPNGTVSLFDQAIIKREVTPSGNVVNPRYADNKSDDDLGEFVPVKDDTGTQTSAATQAADV